MKILQIITRNELRGAEVFAAQLSENLALRGHQVALAALYSPVEGAMRLSANNVEQVELNGRRKGRVEPQLLYRLIQLIRRFRPDVIQANASHALKYAVAAKILKQYKGGIVYRNISMTSRWITRKRQRQLGSFLVHRADYVSSVSDLCREDLCDTFRLSPCRAVTIKRGVEVPEVLDRKAAREQICRLIQSNPEDPILFHVGGFTEEKNHAGLLQAFSEIKVLHPDARLVMCGDGPLRSGIELEIAKSGMSQSIFSLGAVDNVGDLLTGADLLLLPSKVEGIPGVVLEAAVRRVPAIATDVGGVSEAILHDKTGILVQRDDIAAMANSASSLLMNETARIEMGKSARSLIKSRHSMFNSVNQFEDLFQSLTMPVRA